MDETRVTSLVHDLVDNMSSVSPGAEDFLVDTEWALALIDAALNSDPDPAEDDDPRWTSGEHAVVAVHDLEREPAEVECPECGETYPADDGTLDPTSQLEVCVPCADRLGLLEGTPPCA
jgi:hypothetical protein